MRELTDRATTAARDRTIRWRSDTVWKILMYLTLVAFALVFLMPFLWMLSTSFKNTEQTYTVPPIWIPNPFRLENYPEAMAAQPFGRFFLNTIGYSFGSSLGAVFSASVVAYGFSRIRWYGRNFLFALCLCTLMIPFQVQMIPLYLIFRNLHWLNTYLPLIVPNWFGSAYFIFLLRQFFLSLPIELSDAARIDGAGELTIFLRVILPLARPAIAVVALFQFINAWNDYLGPLIYLNQPLSFPISLGLEQFMGQFVEKLAWPYLMAASTVTILPIVIIFFIAQRTFIEGIAISGIKG